jgi:Glycosyltransferase family 87
MARGSWIGIFCLLIAASISLVFGGSLARNSPAGMADFKAIYYGSRCVFEHRDPYRPSDFLQVYSRENGTFPSNPELRHLFFRAVPICINLPTSLFLLAPISFVPWSLAAMIWMTISFASLTIASILTWGLSRAYSPNLSLILSCFVLANCQVLLMSGNLAGVAIGFCVVGVWCFLKNQYVAVGVICFALGLALKPQDVGFVWLYFLLAKGTHRKFAIWSFGVTIAIGLLSAIWISNASPHWLNEMRANQAVTSAKGDLSDPGPASSTLRNPAMIIDLRSIISLIDDDPGIYGPTALLVIGGMVGIWTVRVLRRRAILVESTYLALAAVVPLTMLPVYHRLYDAKLLLLTIPACSVLFDRARWKGKLAFTFTGLGILFAGDIPASLIDNATRHLPKFTGGAWSVFETILFFRQVPLILFVMGAFYLWIFWRSAKMNNIEQEKELSDSEIQST